MNTNQPVFCTASLFKVESCWRDAVVIGAMSVEGACGSRQPFDARIHTLRRHNGQIVAAGCFRRIMRLRRNWSVTCHV